MKINLLFHSLSITKVISTICLLILIISGTHILNVLSTYNSQSENNADIVRLTDLKHAINTFAIESKYSHDGLQDSLDNIKPMISYKPLENRIFNVSDINESNLQLTHELELIQTQLSKLSDNKLSQYKLAYRLESFLELTTITIEQYRTLLNEEAYLLSVSEIAVFFMIALCSLFLLIYSRSYIVRPLKTLGSNVTSITNHRFNVEFPDHKNEVGVLSTGMKSMSSELQTLIIAMQKKVFDKTTELESANETIQFLYTISQQLSTVQLTNPIIKEALDALAKQTNLTKLCLEYVNGTQINSCYGSAKEDPNKKRIPIIISGKPFGYLNFVQPIETIDNSSIITSFCSLLSRALYQEEYTLQEQKFLLMEERGVIARELHDSIAQALTFLKIQCTVLHRQIENSGNDKKSIDSVNNIEEAVSEAYVQLRSLLSTFRLSITESDFKEAVLVMISQLQKQTTSNIQMGAFDANFQTHANQHIHLLQIIREAIINSMKHASANNITINCVILENKVHVSISDDGVGIKKNPGKNNHYGLEIMNQRAAELNAKLEIQNLSVGTEVKLIFNI